MSMASAAVEIQPTPHILVVDDDAQLRAEISGYLCGQGMKVDGAGDAEVMEQLLKSHPIDLVVLDVMLPGEDGLSICRRLLGAKGPPIILLSALGHEVDKIVGLELGADDYLPKPCNPRELLARVRAVLRRKDDPRQGRGATGALTAFAGFKLELTKRQLRAPGNVAVLLTGGEFSLLSAFLARPNRILSRDELLELSHGENADVFDRAIDVQVSRLRRKLHAHTEREIIRTYRNAGYMLDASVKRA